MPIEVPIDGSDVSYFVKELAGRQGAKNLLKFIDINETLVIDAFRDKVEDCTSHYYERVADEYAKSISRRIDGLLLTLYLPKGSVLDNGLTFQYLVEKSNTHEQLLAYRAREGKGAAEALKRTNDYVYTRRNEREIASLILELSTAHVSRMLETARIKAGNL
ncbi:hypothetical protein HY992_03455 [Candidatus Micrarchaeota archaeon]|nr:hypothetical protein [Candidatus Micrarchaeota archaeon]